MSKSGNRRRSPPMQAEAASTKTVIFAQCPHNDWDWETTFPDYFAHTLGNNTSHPPVWQNFETAARFSNDQNYYSICETAFLQAFAANDPEGFAAMVASKDYLCILGGGITSPDNLLPHGETFIRDYLLGNTWIREHLGTEITTCWLPDDFGHDSQLPVVLQAMGFRGVGFARIPNSYDQHSHFEPLDRKLRSSATMLLDTETTDGRINGGVDFIWQGRDGSSLLAHWLQNHYDQGEDITPDEAVVYVGTCLQGTSYPDYDSGVDPSNSQQGGEAYDLGNEPVSPTEYIFVPVGSDFSAPVTDLAESMANWNQQSPPPDVKAVATTFADYVNRVLEAYDRDPAVLHTRAFTPNPYHTGFYASRPLLKSLHQRATRSLLAAEVFGSLADAVVATVNTPWQFNRQMRRSAIASGWSQLVPGNHHDFITGTSSDSVYLSEQVPLLKTAAATGEGARELSLTELAAAIDAQPQDGETPVAVFNPLGFDRLGEVRNGCLGLVEVAVPVGMDPQGVRLTGSSEIETIQRSHEGGVMFRVPVRSMGYTTAYLTGAAPLFQPVVPCTVTLGDGQITLENARLKVVLSVGANWGISSLFDKDLQIELLETGAVGNDLIFYSDSGGTAYQFGNELTQADPPSSDDWALLSADVTPCDAGSTPRILEDGPLRVRVLTQVVATVSDKSYVYSREYALALDEDVLRMKTTGDAPTIDDGDGSYGGTSVMTRFPLREKITGISHGTPYHWNDELPVRYWYGQTFQATHDFVIMHAGSDALGAVYHAALPAWGAEYFDTGEGDGATAPGRSIYGCLFRNQGSTDVGSSDNTGYSGQFASDQTQTVEYAFRAASGMPDPASGQPLREALAYQSPLLATLITMYQSAQMAEELPTSLPESLHLVSISSPGDAAILTAAKPAEDNPDDLILRVYQPTNSTLPVTLTLGHSGKRPEVETNSALETPLPDGAADELDVQTDAGVVTFQAPYAISTLRIKSYLHNPLALYQAEATDV